MEYEMEITERLAESIYETLKSEMARGWSLDQLAPILANAVNDAVEKIEGE